MDTATRLSQRRSAQRHPRSGSRPGTSTDTNSDPERRHTAGRALGLSSTCGAAGGLRGVRHGTQVFLRGSRCLGTLSRGGGGGGGVAVAVVAHVSAVACAGPVAPVEKIGWPGSTVPVGEALPRGRRTPLLGLPKASGNARPMGWRGRRWNTHDPRGATRYINNTTRHVPAAWAHCCVAPTSAATRVHRPRPG